MLAHLDEYSVNLLKIYIQSDVSLAENVCVQTFMSKDADIIIKHCLLYIQALIKKCQQVSGISKRLKWKKMKVLRGLKTDSENRKWKKNF